MYHSAIWKIDFKALANRGIRYLIIDVDSTITEAYTNEADPRAKAAIKEALDSGLIKNACLVSNVMFGRRKIKRVARMAQDLGIPYVAAMFFSAKPSASPFLKGLKKMEATINDTAVIGDLIFTDILGGNLLGMFTILLKPLGKPHWTTRISLQRMRERQLLKRMGIELNDS